MNTNTVTAIVITIAAVTSGGVILAVPAVGLAALRGNPRATLYAAGFALVFFVLAFTAFTVLGAGVVHSGGA